MSKSVFLSESIEAEIIAVGSEISVVDGEIKKLQKTLDALKEKKDLLQTLSEAIRMHAECSARVQQLATAAGFELKSASASTNASSQHSAPGFREDFFGYWDERK